MVEGSLVGSLASSAVKPSETAVSSSESSSGIVGWVALRAGENRARIWSMPLLENWECGVAPGVLVGGLVGVWAGVSTGGWVHVRLLALVLEAILSSASDSKSGGSGAYMSSIKAIPVFAMKAFFFFQNMPTS